MAHTHMGVLYICLLVKAHVMCMYVGGCVGSRACRWKAEVKIFLQQSIRLAKDHVLNQELILLGWLASKLERSPCLGFSNAKDTGMHHLIRLFT